MRALPAIIFLAIGFNLVVFSTNLLLNDYQFGRSVVATIAALVVGQVVLVAETMPVFRRFESAPLILPVLFKTCVYTLFVFIARLIGAYIHYMINEGRLIGIFSFMYEQFLSVGMPNTRHLPGWHGFFFIQLWISVLFLIYTTGAELNRLLGYGQVFLFVDGRSHSVSDTLYGVYVLRHSPQVARMGTTPTHFTSPALYVGVRFSASARPFKPTAAVTRHYPVCHPAVARSRTAARCAPRPVAPGRACGGGSRTIDNASLAR